MEAIEKTRDFDHGEVESRRVDPDKCIICGRDIADVQNKM